MPDQLDQIAALAPEHEQLPAEGIGLQLLLHQHRQPAKALPHVRVTRRQPDPDTCRDRDHRPSRTAITRFRACTSTGPLSRTRRPLASSISIKPLFTADVKKRLSDLWAALNSDPEMKELAAKSGFELVNVGTAEMDAFMKDKTKLYTESAKRLGLGK